MKKIVIIIIVCLCFVGCENENVIEEKPEEKVNEINVNSELFFLENGNEFKNYILLANNDESILKTNYSIEVEYVMENDDKVFLMAKCNVYNSEYSFCMEGTEELIINGKSIMIYNGNYYNTGPTTTNHLRGYVRKFGNYFITYDGYDFEKLGAVNVYDYNGNKIYTTESNVTFGYFDENDKINSIYPEITNSILKFYTCDVKNDTVNEYNLNIETSENKLVNSFTGYCNKAQKYFDFKIGK